MTAKMKGPEGHSGLSYAGVSYEPDADGIIEIPQEAIGEAMNHGFTLASAQPESGKPIPSSADLHAANLAKMTKKQLVAFGKDNLGLELDESDTAKELIAAIEAALEAKAAEIHAETESKQGEGAGAE